MWANAEKRLLGVCAGLATFIHASAAAEPRVAVTSKPIHALVASVMRGVAAPEVLIEGAASPHTYALKPSDAQKLNRADVVFRVSEGFEPFTGKLFKALPKTAMAVTLEETPELNLLAKRTSATFDAHAHGHGHKQYAKKSGYDSHIWLDPNNANAIAARVAEVLAQRFPEYASKFQTNAETLRASIEALAAELEDALKPVRGKPFVVFHDAYQYFEQRFGLTAAGSITVSPDVAPSAKRLSDLRKKIASLGAVCVFAEPPFEPRLVATVTEGTKARSALLDPEGVTLAAGPELYSTLMRNLARGFKDCLDAT